MAEKRMFAKQIIDSDAFLDMPLSTQTLYFHLSMRADDDGFINNPKKIQRMIGASEDDLKVLIGKRFIIPFESGIVVIKHWRIHNYIQKDRYKETKYKEEKATLMLDENNSYTTCIQTVHELETQDRLGKVSSGKDRSEQQSAGDCSLPEAGAMARPPSATEVMIYVKQKKYKIPFTGYCEVWARSPEEAEKLADNGEMFYAEYDFGEPVSNEEESE